MANNYGDRTHCANNHEFTPENTRWRKDGGRVCRACKRERESARRAKLNSDPAYRAARQLSDRLSKRRARGTLEDADLAKYDDKKTAVQRVLGIKPEAMPAHEAMSEWFESNRSPCFEQPELYSDYDDPRYPEEQTGRPFPSTSQAEALCSDCPLRGDKGLCLEFALKNKEDFGIWGGKRIVAGRIYQGGSGRRKEEK
jgi:hypothetical protein